MWLRDRWPIPPKWLVDSLGIDYFSNVDGVVLRNTGTDKDLMAIACLRHLRFLNLGNSPITDGGLKKLSGLTNLTQLRLHGTRISDVGLSHLEGLTRLWELFLVDTRVTDAGLGHLRCLSQLDEVCLPWSVSDHGLQELKKDLPKATIKRGFPYVAHVRQQDIEW